MGTLRAAPLLVLQPPTGSGKTQGLCLYAALTLKKNTNSPHKLAILVVTRTTDQADELVTTIRQLAGLTDDTTRVIARHYKNPINGDAMMEAEVLVITHQAFTLAFEEITKEGQTRRWDMIKSWKQGSRDLTVIDEALANVVDQYEVRADYLNQVLGFIPSDIRNQFPQQIDAIKTVIEVLEKIRSWIKEGETAPRTSFVRRPDNDKYIHSMTPTA